MRDDDLSGLSCNRTDEKRVPPTQKQRKKHLATRKAFTTLDPLLQTTSFHAASYGQNS
ncbi:hypothetical protein ON064_05165 [Planococcus sp. A6]|uniref:hypothetical protein n=1 Tax=Planococcus sp. A6 TaxID=2992760 RepID=UPI00237BE06C|nr:hypothetical protein [Planococcus sp. A6]MDE0582434.1 hypothetical protein [Planococcus sp. A6]